MVRTEAMSSSVVGEMTQVAKQPQCRDLRKQRKQLKLCYLGGLTSVKRSGCQDMSGGTLSGTVARDPY